MLAALTALLVMTVPTDVPRSPTAQESTRLNLTLCCTPKNDLYQILRSIDGKLARFDSAEEATKNAPEGSGVLILADDYPRKTTSAKPKLITRAQRRRLRLYVEYPLALPDLRIDEPRRISWERAVVSSNIFGPSLKKLTILAIHDCHFVPIKVENAEIVLARVAGFDTAIYGLPEQTFPVLFKHPKSEILVATTKLSHFVSGRYGPEAAWKAIWRRILGWLSSGKPVPEIAWTPTLYPSFGRTDTLPEDVEEQALRRGVEWFVRSGLLKHTPPQRALAKRDKGGFGVAAEPGNDGRHGILEGFSSRIDYNGSQAIQEVLRGDCNGESAMALAFGAIIERNPDYERIATNILDFWYSDSIAHKGVRADPAHPAYGLVAWGITSPEWEIAFYGDDNARLLLGSIATAALLRNDSWNDAITKCLLGNLRTTGKLGFRRDRIDLPDLAEKGWQYYSKESAISYAPHYQAYLWACYLWAYRQTAHRPFLTKTKNAIRITMEAYPDKWRWTNGIAQERARMLLPLAWLIRIEDTQEHREWLLRIATDLLRLQAPCGAVGEELGPAELGTYGPPRSNEEFGKDEATLIQQNGDPACDLLYTTNFAFLGLHEAAKTTGDSYYANAEEKLAQFLCRIQIYSEDLPELDGGWYRAFDFERWEYWGSSADIGWGPWCIESGWTQGWITTVFGMRQMDTSLWDLTADVNLSESFSKLKPQFISE